MIDVLQVHVDVLWLTAYKPLTGLVRGRHELYVGGYLNYDGTSKYGLIDSSKHSPSNCDYNAFESTLGFSPFWIIPSGLSIDTTVYFNDMSATLGNYALIPA